MRKALFLFWLLALLVPGARGASPQEAFDAANALYEAGDMNGALTQYTALASAISNWKIHYNMGNCLFKLERYVMAKVQYLRARRLAPMRQEIRRNLEMVNQRLGEDSGRRPPGFLTVLWNRTLNALPMTVISITLILFVFALNGFLVAILLRGKSKWRIYGLVFFLVLALILVGLQGIRTHRLAIRDTAVVTRARAQLRSGPGTSHTVLFTLRPGMEIHILEQREQWIQVTASNDIAGWISMESVEVI